MAMFKMCFVFSVTAGLVMCAPPTTEKLNTKLCTFILEAMENGKFRLNKLDMTDEICITMTEYQCNVPWIARLCPGDVKVRQCFNTKKLLTELWNEVGELKKKKPFDKHLPTEQDDDFAFLRKSSVNSR